MKKVLALIAISTLINCTAFRSGNQELGLLTGTVGLLEGDCMPSPNSPPCEPRPISTWVYATLPSEGFAPEKVVDSVRSIGNGQFSMNLSPGKYSLFAKYAGEVACTQFNCNPDCFCQPVDIAADSTSTVTLVVNKATW